MKKRTYIQPKMTAQPTLADMSVMLLNSNSGMEPGKSAQGRLNVNPAFNRADTTAVF